MAVRGTCNGVDVIVKLDGTNRHLMVLKLEGGDLVERSGGAVGQPVLEGTQLRVGTTTVEIAEDQRQSLRYMLVTMRTVRGVTGTRQGEGMRRAARRIEIAGGVMVVMAIVLGLVVLVTRANEDSGAAALFSALLTWALSLPLAIAVYSLGEYLGIESEER
jgi:hypothetical protein